MKNETSALPAFSALYDSASWTLSSSVDRSFVKYSNTDPTNAEITVLNKFPATTPSISILIPTSGSARDTDLRNLLAQLDNQTFCSFEVIIVKNDNRQGRAINTAAAVAKGKYVVTLDDDTSLPEQYACERLFTVMETDLTIGIAGGSNVIPDSAPPFVKKAMFQIPRRSWKPVEKITESDLAQHGCMIMRTKEFKEIGGEHELIPRGLDPYLRNEYRKRGQKIVLIPGVSYHHLIADSLPKLVRQFYKNGRVASFANRHYSQWIIETPSTHKKFIARVPLPLRVLRYPLRMFSVLLRGHYIRFCAEAAYAVGFIREWFERSMEKKS